MNERDRLIMELLLRGDTVIFIVDEAPAVLGPWAPSYPANLVDPWPEIEPTENPGHLEPIPCVDKEIVHDEHPWLHPEHGEVWCLGVGRGPTVVDRMAWRFERFWGWLERRWGW